VERDTDVTQRTREQRHSAAGSPLGLHRVLEPAGVLPQAAWRLDPDPRIWPDEVRVRVDRLNLDAASFRQLRESSGGSPGPMRAAVLEIIATRGKMQNPVTGSGGMLTGVVEEAGSYSPLGLAAGDRIATLVSLSLTPLVIIDEDIAGLPPGASVVTSDNEVGGALAAGHLCDLGHREIGVIAGPEGLPTAEARLRGFATVLCSRGIPLPPGRVVRASYYTRDAGLVMGRELLTSHPEVTAVYCANDLIALGVVTAAGECGRRVGRDLSLAGFDDIFVSQLVDPALTTVRQPIARLGTEAARIALQALEGRRGKPRRLVLPVELVVRGSTAPVSSTVPLSSTTPQTPACRNDRHVSNARPTREAPP